MKALVINETRSHYGFIIDVEQNRDGSYYDSAADLVYQPRELQFQWEENPTPVDWPSFRREVAKDILCALVGNKDYLKVIGRIEPETMLAIRFADELIKKLKEEPK